VLIALIEKSLDSNSWRNVHFPILPNPLIPIGIAIVLCFLCLFVSSFSSYLLLFAFFGYHHGHTNSARDGRVTDL
jgi:hypothetical protein